MNSTWTLRLDEFPCENQLDLVVHPVRSITSAVYYDSANASTTWGASNYELLRTRRFSYLVKADNTVAYPVVSYTKEKPLTITMVAGYPDPATDTTDDAKRAKVPAAAKSAMKLLIGHWFKNREAVLVGVVSKEIELGYQALIDSFSTKRYA